jgi:hypothetical protein
MKENEYKIAGFSFADANDYKEAKREAETIDYIRANTDLNDLNKAMKLYHKLVERKTLKTVVGLSFLKELQERIIKEGIVRKDSMPCIQIEKNEKQLRAYSGAFEQEQEKRHLALIEDYKIKLRNSRIISAFLVVIVIIMIMIAIFSDRTLFLNYQNKILDQNSAWEEDLKAREKAIEEMEAQNSTD